MTASPGPALHLVRALLLVLLGLAPVACLVTSRPWLRSPSRELVVPGDGHRLAYGNGLTLLVVPDAQTRAVQFDVRHHVGSRDDPAGQAQLAHLVEHLMFELPTAGPGTPSLGVEARDRALLVNAYTSPDETHYVVTGLPEQLETYVRHAARRLAFDCAELDDATFARVREVVQNEIRWRREGVDARLTAQVMEAVFPAGHPYRDVERDELASVTREDACAFIERHYVPARTTVVVSGNVTPEAVEALTDVHLGLLPAVEVEPRAPVPAVQPSARRVTIGAPVGEASGLVLFPMPARFSPEHIPASVAIEAVSAAMMAAAAKRDSAIETWSIGTLGGKQAQLLVVDFSTKTPARLDAAFDEALDAIYAIFALKFSMEALDRVRQQRRLRILESVADLSSRSSVYADYLEEGDEPSFVAGELAAIDRLTPDRVRRVGRSVFSPDHAITVAIVPGSTKADDARVDRAELTGSPVPEPFVGIEVERLPADIDPTDAHRPAKLEDMEPPDLQMKTVVLRNGMRVTLVASSQFPIMEARLIYGVGTLHTPEQPLVAYLADLAYGPRDPGALALIDLFDLAGGRFDADVGPLSTEFRARGMSIYLDFLIAGLAEAYAHGTYRPEVFAIGKARAVELVEDERTERLLGANHAYLAALYGEDHPYAGTLGDVKSLRQSQVLRFHRAYYRASNATLVVTGGFDMTLALEHVRGAFESPRDLSRLSTWQRPGTPPPKAEIPPLDTDRGRVITRVVEGKTQTQVTIGYPLPEVLGYGHAGLMVIAAMLEHEVAAVREELGASYGVHTQLHIDWPRLEITGELDSARAGPALAELRAAIGRVLAPESFDRRFVHARRQVLRELLGARGDPQQFGLLVATALRHGRSIHYFRGLAHAVATLTSKDLRAHHEAWLAEDNAVMLIQGPAAGIAQATAHNGLTRLRALPPLRRAQE